MATWGSCISDKQLRLIQSWPEIVMMLDADKGNQGTQKKAKDLVHRINSAGGAKAINIDLGIFGVESPDDLPSSDLEAIVESQWHEQLHNNQ